MSTYSDLKMARLELSGYTTGAIGDRWSQYLKDSTAWEVGDSQQLNDLEGLWLEMQGAVGNSLPDKWYSFAGAFSTSGHITDRLYAFWATETPLP